MKKVKHRLPSKKIKAVSGRPYLTTAGYQYHICCDCRLVHLFKIDLDDKTNEFTISAYRDDHLTRLYRKAKKGV